MPWWKSFPKSSGYSSSLLSQPGVKTPRTLSVDSTMHGREGVWEESAPRKLLWCQATHTDWYRGYTAGSDRTRNGFKLKGQRFRFDTGKMSGSEALGQVAQRYCGCHIPGSVQARLDGTLSNQIERVASLPFRMIIFEVSPRPNYSVILWLVTMAQGATSTPLDHGHQLYGCSYWNWEVLHLQKLPFLGSVPRLPTTRAGWGLWYLPGT